jgi:predicted acetyltransferase
LGQVLDFAAGVGIDPVLAGCREDNAGSVATLERFGATLLRTEVHGSVRVGHYAIATGADAVNDQ